MRQRPNCPSFLLFWTSNKIFYYVPESPSLFNINKKLMKFEAEILFLNRVDIIFCLFVNQQLSYFGWHKVFLCLFGCFRNGWGSGIGSALCRTHYLTFSNSFSTSTALFSPQGPLIIWSSSFPFFETSHLITGWLREGIEVYIQK